MFAVVQVMCGAICMYIELLTCVLVCLHVYLSIHMVDQVQWPNVQAVLILNVYYIRAGRCC